MKRRALRRVALSLASTLCSLAAACGASGNQRGESAGGGAKLEVVTSFYPIAEAAMRVGGDRTEVVNLTPAGTEPHDLELTPRQVDQVQDAEVVLYLGQGFQPAVEEIAERRGAKTVDLLEGLPLDEGNQAEGQGEEGPDPHFWLDPTLMGRAVDRIEDAYGAVAAAHRSEFEGNAAAYKAELEALDAESMAALSGCRRKELVTSHAAFHYLAKRYGLTQVAIAGLSPEAEPDAQRLADLANLVRQRGVTTIFYETLVSPDVARTLARETGARTAVLNPIEGLTEEQLGKGETYLSVMRANVAVLEQALGCR